ncbi:MAG: acyl carrier protein [Bacteroidales bacterium]
MEKKINDILSEIRPEFDFYNETDFIEQGMLDSFDIVSLVSTLDKEFDISIDGLDILPENFSSIKSIIALIKKNGAK